MVAIGHEFSADCTMMQSIVNDDASMPDAVNVEHVDISGGAMEWLQANQHKLEDMVRNNQRIYNFEEWEVFERWAYNQSDRLNEAKAQKHTLERQLQQMEIEKTEMLARIARLESIKQVASGQGETFSSVHQDYCTGMIAIERLVCSATRADERTLLPAGGEERIMDHLDKLVERMAHMEKRRMMAHEEQRGGDWDPATSLLANKPMHDLLYTSCFFLLFLMALLLIDFG